MTKRSKDPTIEAEAKKAAEQIRDKIKSELGLKGSQIIAAAIIAAAGAASKTEKDILGTFETALSAVQKITAAK
jgi:hypothetical protein